MYEFWKLDWVEESDCFDPVRQYCAKPDIIDGERKCDCGGEVWMVELDLLSTGVL